MGVHPLTSWPDENSHKKKVTHSAIDTLKPLDSDQIPLKIDLLPFSKSIVLGNLAIRFFTVW